MSNPLDGIILRETINPPLVAKGSALEYPEMDNNLILFYNAIKALQSGGVLQPYSGGAYDASTAQYVSFTNGGVDGIYLCISPASAGQSPSSHPSSWKLMAENPVQRLKSFTGYDGTAGGINKALQLDGAGGFKWALIV